MARTGLPTSNPRNAIGDGTPRAGPSTDAPGSPTLAIFQPNTRTRQVSTKRKPNEADLEDDEDPEDATYQAHNGEDDEDEETPRANQGSNRKRARTARTAKPLYGVAATTRKVDDEEDLHPEDDEEDAPLPEEEENIPLAKTVAHSLKEQFLAAGGMGTPPVESPSHNGKRASMGAGGHGSVRRPYATHDPENHDIKILRTQHALSWSEIARILNAARVTNGGVPNLTEASVYGRFVRNAPRIAAQQGEEGFEVRNHMHLKVTNTLDGGYGPGNPAGPKNKGAGGAGPGKAMKWTTRFDQLLVETCVEVKAKFWGDVAEQMGHKTGRKFAPEACAERFNLL